MERRVYFITHPNVVVEPSVPVSRTRDQSANGGGNYFAFSMASPKPDSWWNTFDSAAA